MIDRARIVLVESTDSALELINQYAPEHLIIQTHHAEILAEQIQHAGSVFIGQWTPESLGDYASGTNHTLPTNGAARAFSGVVAGFVCAQDHLSAVHGRWTPCARTKSHHDGTGRRA